MAFPNLEIGDAVFSSRRIGDTMRMGVPAFCYGLQNLLFFVALSNLSATSYQLWSQTKVLFTENGSDCLYLLTSLLGKVVVVQMASACPFHLIHLTDSVISCYGVELVKELAEACSGYVSS